MSASPTESCGVAHCALCAGAPAANATLVLDVGGRIQFCSEAAARLFGYRGAELLGRSIRSLVPELPLRASTGGYNTAYVRFRFADDAWHGFRGVAADQRAIPLEISLGMLRLGDRRGFVAALRHPASEADRGRPVRPATSGGSRRAAVRITRDSAPARASAR